MPWDVVATDEFAAWYDTLEALHADAIDARVELLATRGPTLGRPTVDRVEGSMVHNQELRVSAGGHLRVLFAFDAHRHIVLLLGGDKTGEWSEWYRRAIPVAEALLSDHLEGGDDEDLG